MAGACGKTQPLKIIYETQNMKFQHVLIPLGSCILVMHDIILTIALLCN